MEGYSEAKDVTITYELSGVNATYEFWTDVNGVLTQRQTLALTPTNGRKEQTIPLDGLYWRLRQHRIVAPSGATLALYAGSMRYRTIGTFLDGSAGDVWRTRVTPLGMPERLKLFREVALDCTITGGNVTIQISTEVPSTLTVRKTATITTGGERKTVRVRLPWSTKGYHVEMLLTPANGVTMALFEAKIETKPVGLPNPTGWDWAMLYAEPSPEPWKTERWAIPGFDPVPQWIDIPVDAIE